LAAAWIRVDYAEVAPVQVVVENGVTENYDFFAFAALGE
jgi:hypothetical protein